MSYLELIDVLQDYEQSPFYGDRDLKISEHKARKHVFSLSAQYHEIYDKVVDEADSSEESSNSS